MRIQLRGQAEELLGKSELVIITERVDDVALLIGQMGRGWACRRYWTDTSPAVGINGG